MVIVNAEWEKRNLGVDTVEILIEQQDTAEQIKDLLNQTTARYIVIKLPTHRADLTVFIQEHGFTYIEDMCRMVSYLPEVHKHPLEQRLEAAVTVDIMSDTDMEQVYKEVENGMFQTDRILLDPYFTSDAAHNRYINWIADEYKRGTKFLKYIYKGNTIGFFALRETSPGKYDSFIGGIYPQHRKGGMGTVLKVPDVVKEWGGNSVSTHVSTNNPAQIRNLIRNGYIIEDIVHTFIRHND